MVSFIFFKGTDAPLVYGFMGIFIAAGNFSTSILQDNSKYSTAGVLAAI